MVISGADVPPTRQTVDEFTNGDHSPTCTGEAVGEEGRNSSMLSERIGEIHEGQGNDGQITAPCYWGWAASELNGIMHEHKTGGVSLA